jgi:hypothetical protein
MRNGVRINPLQKRLCIICIQIRREFLIEIMLLFVMSLNYDDATPDNLHRNQRRLHVPQSADETGSRRIGWDLF